MDKRDENNEDEELYTIEFIFDTDISCAVRVFLLAREELNNGIARFDHSVSFEDNEWCHCLYFKPNLKRLIIKQLSMSALNLKMYFKNFVAEILTLKISQRFVNILKNFLEQQFIS